MGSDTLRRPNLWAWSIFYFSQVFIFRSLVAIMVPNVFFFQFLAFVWNIWLEIFRYARYKCLSLFFTRSALRTELPSSRLTCCLVLVVVIVTIISAHKKKIVNPLDGECVPVRLNMHQRNCDDHLCLLLRTILSGFVVLEFVYLAKRPNLSGMSWKVFDTRGGKFLWKARFSHFFPQNSIHFKIFC